MSSLVLLCYTVLPCGPQFEQLEQYVPRYLVYAILWSFSGDGKMKSRIEMGDFVRGVTTIPLPPNTSVPIIDHEVSELVWSL